MSVEGLVYLLILVVVVLGIAWAIDYALAQTPAPPPVRYVVWIIAALILLLLLLRQLRLVA